MTAMLGDIAIGVCKMNAKEVFAREYCRKMDTDPDRLVNVDGLGTMRPYWTICADHALGDVWRAAAESCSRRDAEIADAYRQGWVDHAAASVAPKGGSDA